MLCYWMTVINEVVFFLVQLLDSTVYGERRGAAYGLASLVKGLGILSLKQQKVMSTLQDAIQDKKNYRHREGWNIKLHRQKRPRLVASCPQVEINLSISSNYHKSLNIRLVTTRDVPDPDSTIRYPVKYIDIRHYPVPWSNSPDIFQDSTVTYFISSIK